MSRWPSSATCVWPPINEAATQKFPDKSKKFTTFSVASPIYGNGASGEIAPGDMGHRCVYTGKLM
eukprot:CAMPEP_0115420562 /NCGR_PEP_ID=MMETSP0271-20121206/25792_1 /TAXON_ID=71861 /ORGANISM="Scrippsiella trochoidea, Strain CCMP3099" /LENGTH=64 /DNA_ID=CAMNT_0002845161 /DNA_START=28 /DNA_END=221 /DNA_ORIENTATION=+